MKPSLLTGVAGLLALAGVIGMRLDSGAAALFSDRDRTPGSLREWVARGFSLRRVSADLVWMEMIQHTGDGLYHVDGGKALAGMAEEATELDQRFTFVHMFGGGMLMWNCNRPKDAIRLLEKGVRDNPQEKRLKLYLAAFTYSRLGDLGGEVGILERLAVTPGVPPMLWRILANVYSKQGRKGDAVRMWKFIAKHSPDAGDQAWARRKLVKSGIPAGS